MAWISLGAAQGLQIGRREADQAMATAVGELTIWTIVALVGIVILALALGNQ